MRKSPSFFIRLLFTTRLLCLPSRSSKHEWHYRWGPTLASRNSLLASRCRGGRRWPDAASAAAPCASAGRADRVGAQVGRGGEPRVRSDARAVVGREQQREERRAEPSGHARRLDLVVGRPAARAAPGAP